MLPLRFGNPALASDLDGSLVASLFGEGLSFNLALVAEAFRWTADVMVTKSGTYTADVRFSLPTSMPSLHGSPFDVLVRPGETPVQ